MGEPIALLEDEDRLRNDIRDLVAQAKARARDHELGDETRRLIKEMGSKAHELHMKLLERDVALEPTHHKYMVKNRGVSPRDQTFYDHIHPVEDLLKFLEDRDANADPEDRTIGHEFTFRVYSRRWGHDDHYRIQRTETGWQVDHMSIGGPCNKRGEPALFANFSQDDINYPAALPEYMERLWRDASADGEGLDQVALQERLERLAEWVSTTERATPEFG